MQQNEDTLLAALSPAIDEKCRLIQEKKLMKRKEKLFLFMCTAAVILPILFVLFGISLMILLIPCAFIGITFNLLSPVMAYYKRRSDL